MKKTLSLMLLSCLLAACVKMPPDQVSVTRPQFDDLHDDDGDGVINQRDLCAQTPATAQVDNTGCAKWQVVAPTVFFVHFDLDKDVIRPDQESTLRKIIDMVKTTPGATVALVGDTSAEGTAEHNRELGERRALSISRFLQDKGVAAASIEKFIWTDEPVKDRLKKRERRTIVQVRAPGVLQSAPAWTIYSAEERMNARSAK